MAINFYKFTVRFLLIINFAFIVSCTIPIRIDFSTINTTCPSEVATSRVIKIMDQELQNRHVFPCENISPRPTMVTNLYGSDKGSFWNDYVPCHEPQIIGIRKIVLSYDENVIRSIQVTYFLADRTTYTEDKHGSGGSHTSTIILAGNERISYVGIGTNGSAIIQLTFRSQNPNNRVTAHGPYGQVESDAAVTEGYILSFRGYSSDKALHSFSAYFLPPLFKGGLYGGTCRNTSYDDKVDTLIPPVVSISSIVLRHGALIDRIQATYRLLDGTLFTGAKIGGPGGGSSTINFDGREIITRLNVSSYETFLGQLIFQATLQGAKNNYGPYGYDVENSLVLSRHILGFLGFSDYHFGVAEDVLCSIGVYYIST